MAESWHLIAAREDPRADALEILLLAHRLPVTRAEGGPLPVLLAPHHAPIPLYHTDEVLAVLTPWLPAGEDDRHRVARLLDKALPRLAGLDPNAFPSDLDLVIYMLRQDLRALDALLGTHPKGDSTLLLAPLLWRIGLLDQHFALFLLSGLPHLTQLHDRQRACPLLARYYDQTRALRYLGRLQNTRSPTDWSRALGPEGHEKSLPPRRNTQTEGGRDAADSL